MEVASEVIRIKYLDLSQGRAFVLYTKRARDFIETPQRLLYVVIGLWKGGKLPNSPSRPGNTLLWTMVFGAENSGPFKTRANGSWTIYL